MIDGELLCRLIPHAGSMCLLDAVEEWGADRILCTTRSHMMPAHPLRRNSELSALHLVEYAAQAIAAHGALLAQNRDDAQLGQATPQPGMLGALRDIRFHVDRIDTITAAISIEARRRLARDDGMVYDFAVAAERRALCAGRVVIALRTLAA